MHYGYTSASFCVCYTEWPGKARASQGRLLLDSALVLKVAHEELGDKAVAFTAISPTFPPEEQAQAQKFTKEWGIPHLLVDSNELEREEYAQNRGDRCYFCKDELFALAQKTARVCKRIVSHPQTNNLGHHTELQRLSEPQHQRH